MALTSTVPFQLEPPGYMDWAFEYVTNNGGIDTEESYYYWGDDGLPCQTGLQDDRHVVAIDGHEDVPANDSLAMKRAIAQQPVSAAICVAEDMQFYSGGVIDAASCCSKLNHAVLVVGYSDDDATPHWLVKNSWGDGAFTARCFEGCTRAFASHEWDASAVEARGSWWNDVAGHSSFSQWVRSCCDAKGPSARAPARKRSDRILTFSSVRPRLFSCFAAWGLGGYFMLASKVGAVGGTCGILQAGSYPLKNSDKNPAYSEFCGVFGLTECRPGYMCECQFDLFGLFCLSWGCAAKDHPLQTSSTEDYARTAMASR